MAVYTPLKIDWSSDPEEEYDHWCQVYADAISFGDRQTIDELKELLPQLEEGF